MIRIVMISHLLYSDIMVHHHQCPGGSYGIFAMHAVKIYDTKINAQDDMISNGYFIELPRIISSSKWTGLT